MREARNIIDEYIKENDTVVVAISGGPDSMALLSLLTQKKEKTNITIVCAHVNHKVRKESEEEAIFVKDYCDKNNVIFEYMEIDKYNKDNFHNYARIVRYNFFEDMLKKYNSNILLTAHHGDDLIETILMRIVRGSTLKGYSGFSYIQKRDSYIILRPLIYETKDSILEYDSLNKIEYVIDASNFKDVYTRNRYRRNILPLLKGENINVQKKFLSYSNTILEADNYIDGVVDKVWNSVVVDGSIFVDKLLLEDSYIQKRIIMRYLEVYLKDLSNITNEHISSILSLINSKVYGCVNLPNKSFVKDRNLCFLKELEQNKSYDIIFDNYISLNDFEIVKVSSTDDNSNNIIRLSTSNIKLPIHIRSKKDGDRMHIKNMDGTRKISDIFTDLKVPITKRDTYPIVVDDIDNILWLPGLKKSNFDVEKTGNYDIILKYQKEEESHEKQKNS